jgi:glutathione peroxidase
MQDSIYSLSANSNVGQPVAFEQFRGQVLLIVNVASQCGFTPQYTGLEALYQKYHAQGLQILGFPCNQFGHQEPGDAQEIATFCSTTYNITFPLMQKIDVNGAQAHPVYQYLKSQAGGILGDGIKWNFTKFLISADGKTIKRYAPTTTPEGLTQDIEAMLKSRKD